MANAPVKSPGSDDTVIEDMRRPPVPRGPRGWMGGPRVNLIRDRQHATADAETERSAAPETPATEEDVFLDDLGGPKDECGFALVPEDTP